MGVWGLVAILGACAALTAPTASATPDDPYGDDWVAMAVSPAGGDGGYGASGTQDGAVQIALSECGQHSSGCVIVSSIEYGCVAFARDGKTHWAGGRGPDKDAAVNDAAAKLPGYNPATLTGGSACSTPLTPP